MDILYATICVCKDLARHNLLKSFLEMFTSLTSKFLLSCSPTMPYNSSGGNKGSSEDSTVTWHNWKYQKRRQELQGNSGIHQFCTLATSSPFLQAQIKKLTIFSMIFKFTLNFRLPFSSRYLQYNIHIFKSNLLIQSDPN